jgi:Fringe-like
MHKPNGTDAEILATCCVNICRRRGHSHLWHRSGQHQRSSSSARRTESNAKATPVQGDAYRSLQITVPAADSCHAQTITPGECSNTSKKIARAEPRQTCAHLVSADDLVFGVWHSLATEHRLAPLLETWGAATNVVLLASKAGVEGTQLFSSNAQPGSNPLLLYTEVAEDDYFSTLGKAFKGLRLMLEQYPTAKWFVILGDDNYLLLQNYLNVLSAFDSEQEWALTRMVYREAFKCKVSIEENNTLCTQ